MAAVASQQANPFADSDDDEPGGPSAAAPPPPPPIDSPYHAMSPSYTMSYPDDDAAADNAIDETNGKIFTAARNE